MKIEKLYPACKSIIWGGEKLKKYYGKETELSPLAETWELSVFEGAESRLQQGACDCNNLAKLRDKHPDWFVY